MCKQGDTVVLSVPNYSNSTLSLYNQWHNADIDRCIAPLVQALNNAGLYTASCCCGHGIEFGHIWLQDGRCLIILLDATKDNISTMINVKFPYIKPDTSESDVI